ncbi:MAG: DUF763 domain-containing protein [Candidatus Micrarchaeia archaeon]
MQGITLLPLHYGKAPKWLFERMKKLGKSISEIIIEEFGVEGFLERLSDPVWFQAFACTLGYDWHSSGSTPVTLAALKEALNEEASSYGIFFAGGKGKTGIKTPEEIEKGCDTLGISKEEELKKASRLSAKVDNAMVYDNINIYCHSFIFSKKDFVVVQQAMQTQKRVAIRFQWFSKKIKDFVNEPHIVSSDFHQKTLDLTFEKNKEIRESTVILLKEDFQKIINFRRENFSFLSLPYRHELKEIDISKKGMELLKNSQVESYEDLLLIKGVGRKTIKSLALIARLIYDKELYTRDPAVFSFTVGGKDGVPYKINKKHYDEVIQQMKLIVENSKIEEKEKFTALKRLLHTNSTNLS